MVSWLVLLILIGGIGFLVWGVARAAGRPRVQAPSCGKCGYAVRGLTTFICPECGSDLRTVGIATPAQASPVAGVIARLILWSVLVFLLGIGTANVARSLTPRTTITTHNLRWSNPQSKAFQGCNFDVECKATARGRWPNSTTRPVTALVVHLLLSNGTESILTIDPVTGKHVGGSFDAEGVRAWMNLSGVDTSNPQVQKEAAEIAACVQALVAQGINANSNAPSFHSKSTSSSSRTLIASYGRLVVGAMTLFWAGGALWIIVHARRKHAAANAATAPAPAPAPGG